ncbi:MULTISPECIES: hypothetical protein [unclassified Dietzia]|uniref:hypothetical protein n=1 Tax=unclassified Dietzia TaxID=2617939 RepID=UPI000D200070|nr:MULTISPECIES: hypothetical protein [unclassified Dietzia]AVZ40335.1 hypothetical protein CT688_13540 [Dietzia sp. JS16-p6b]MBB1025927.1 hypothetical protein [Dietzia sp. DQ12-76]MBB1028707.1 hypothetical protein [Dietzia sp. DQ11-38-2]QGW25821.1 hypothetical protein GJR88_04292 [Dietzia sp. DQ12-45-1b]
MATGESREPGNEFEHGSEDIPFSRWGDIKMRFVASWRQDHIKRYGMYLCVIWFVGLIGYELVMRLLEALGLAG